MSRVLRLVPQMSDGERPDWAIRLQAEREARGWNKREMARQLHKAAGNQHAPVDSLSRQIRGWEAGDHFPRDWATAYATAFGTPEDELFGDAEGVPFGPEWGHESGGGDDPTNRRRFIVDFLASLGLVLPARALMGPGSTHVIGQDHLDLVHAALRELERLDASRGGDLACDGAEALLNRVNGWIHRGAYSSTIGDALQVAAGQLGAWVGWTAYDADRQQMARRYYCETLLAARTQDDLQLESRVLSYMALQSTRLKRPQEAVRLAQTALRVSAGWTTPRMGALLHLRAAQGHAAMRDQDGFRRHLARAKNDYDKGAHDDDLSFLDALTPAEVTGIEGLAYMAMGKPDRAAGLFQIAGQQSTQYRRNSVNYTVSFAEALYQAGDISGAFEVSTNAVPLVAGIDSARTRNKLLALRTSATEERASHAQQFVARYDEAFRDTTKP